MTQELTKPNIAYPDTAKSVIVMRSGLSFFVSRDTADKVSIHIVKQEKHGFLALSEIGQTINTQEIEGVYTPQAYQDMLRIKQGEIKCAYGNWHKKKDIDKCTCAADARKRAWEEAREREREEENKPLTEEERAAGREFFLKMNEMNVLDNPEGFFSNMFRKGNRNNRSIRRSTILEWQEKNPGREPKLTGLQINEDIL